MHIDTLVQKRLAELLAKGEAILAAKTSSSFHGSTIWRVSHAEVLGYCASVSNLLKRAFGESGTHFCAFQAASAKHVQYETEFRGLQAIVSAAKEDYEGGYLFNLRGLVKAEVLDDALEQARELLGSGYKDPACVLVGVALEVAVKELIERNGIGLSKLDKMNVDLCKLGIYNVAKQKQITAWADLRNKAAHGEWSEYSQADVEDMRGGVERFIADYM